MINTSWLKTFCALAEVGHFTRTADRLHMTQSGVSQHIHKLEDHLGAELLIRQGKSFTLSDSGKRLYSQAQEILQSLANLEQQVAADPAYEGLVRIMSPGSVGLKLYPHLLMLQNEHKQLTIDYRFAPNSVIEKAISGGGADLGLMTQVATTSEVECSAIAEEQLLLVTPAGVKNPNWQTLLELGFIDHPDGSHHAGLLLGANFPEFQHSDALPKRGFSNQISLILEPVSLGLGFTVLPAHAISSFANRGSVTEHALQTPVSETLYLCVQRGRALPKRIETVIAEVRAKLNQSR